MELDSNSSWSGEDTGDSEDWINSVDLDFSDARVSDGGATWRGELWLGRKQVAMGLLRGLAKYPDREERRAHNSACIRGEHLPDEMRRFDKSTSPSNLDA